MSAGLAELQLLQAELGGRVSDVGLVENAVALALDRALSKARAQREETARRIAQLRAQLARTRAALGATESAAPDAEPEAPLLRQRDALEEALSAERDRWCAARDRMSAMSDEVAMLAADLEGYDESGEEAVSYTHLTLPTIYSV